MTCVCSGCRYCSPCCCVRTDSTDTTTMDGTMLELVLSPYGRTR